MSDAETVVAYHQRTKHDFHRFAASLGSMDWANQPHPFRYYEGAQVTRLELNRQWSPVSYDLIYEGNSPNPAPVNLATLSDFFYYSLALSAWKQAGTSRWALRVNPSSGNLHPTEAYLLWRSFSADQTTAELCHYVSESHSFESRASFSGDVWQSVMGRLPQGSFLVGLSSIIWREAWKYGERAFRYCQHDIGHALAALRFSAHLCGWTLRTVSTWSSSDISALLGLNRNQDFFAGECEEPELLAVVMPGKADPRDVDLLAPPTDPILAAIHAGVWTGHANRLSAAHLDWPIINDVAAATQKPRTAGADAKLAITPPPPNPGYGTSAHEAHEVIYKRRSAVDMDGVSRISRDQFLTMLCRTLPGSRPPFDAIPWEPYIHLAVFVHRVDGLTPGLYMFVRDRHQIDSLRSAMRPSFAWQKLPSIPDEIPLYLLVEADCRDHARQLSCHQDIAADGFFSLGMIARFAEPLQQHGPWFYRHLFWESGMIGQVLYLEAQAHNVGATGIGCYFDDPTHEVLGLKDREFQDLYHFTVGMPVEDHRLKSWKPYQTAGGRSSP